MRPAPRGRGSIGPAILFSYLVGGLALRLTIRDAVPGLAAWYYATPPLVLLALATACACWSARLRWWVPALVCALLAWRIGTWCYDGQRVARPQASRPQDVRVLCWNTQRKFISHPAVVRELKAAGADVLALSEAGRPQDAVAVGQQVARSFPGYASSALKGGLVVLVRGLVREARYERLGQGPFAAAKGWGGGLLVDVETRAGKLRLLVFDHASNPLVSRASAFQRLDEWLASLHPPVDCVLGDFNTPSSSVHMHGLETSFQHAFGVAGQGWINSWPWPLPLLDLDHIWVSRRWRVLRCRMGDFQASDHRYVLADLAARHD